MSSKYLTPSLCPFLPAFAVSLGVGISYSSLADPQLLGSFSSKEPLVAPQSPSQQSGLRSLLARPGPSWPILIPPGPS